ncbi:MAG: DNA-binding NtrC family response regulator [Planctomycetota bacterium]|jgi:DNA-binding NtrC family response regulator
MTAKRIYVVDDDSLSAEFLVEAVRALGYAPVQHDGAQSALSSLESDTPDLILTDLRMPGMDGIALVQEVQKRYPGLPCVVITANASMESAIDALRLGARDFLMKPCSPDTLELVLERVFQGERLRSENAYLRSELVGRPSTELVAESQPMVEVLRSAARVARSRGTVLITGESGTGKEKVAQSVHLASPRSEQPFIRVNCAALSETLLESELFGHERGAFTGAHKTRIGRFELADKGTILLDEIGDMPPAMQAKLLRVLQEGEFERVGGTHTLSVDVRVIAATNRNLANEVAEGNFREDLYYRLHVLPLHVSPLRERLEDVVPLAKHFAQRYARQNGVQVPVFSLDSRDKLSAWSWPGNVRELENVVHRAVVLCHEGRIDAADLSFGPPANQPKSESMSPLEAIDLDDDTCAQALANHTMADIERVAILATLGETGGNKTEAARRLGLTARTLSNKMKIWRSAGLVA